MNKEAKKCPALFSPASRKYLKNRLTFAPCSTKSKRLHEPHYEHTKSPYSLAQQDGVSGACSFTYYI